ncbi:rhodanese-like domain-containing protein [Desulfovibrio inopinatus]|uniref:rhodanese-like domain-containing protein n=1 Tax=Desulfovibrio inopinatus TaxID=102109 RepID=UPI000406F8F5|nr:rhodanese-like domain-containing protein [Desulfovibrio inopinatus]
MPRPFLLLIAIAIVLLFWDGLWRTLGVPSIRPKELMPRLLGKDGIPPLLVDIRTRIEYGWFHIPGALHKPDLLFDADKADLPRDRDIVVICMTGHRSPIVAKKLQSLGFTKVSHLKWGMLNWLRARGPVVKGQDVEG